VKLLTLIINTNLQQEVSDLLLSLEQVSGFTFCPVEGHGVQDENDAFLSARDKVVGHTPMVRVDILLEEQVTETVLTALRESVNGIQDHGVYWLTTIEQSGKM